MHVLHVPAARRIAGVASVALVAFVVAASLTAPVGAQSAPTQSNCPGGPPVLMLGNPNPGDLLNTGDMIISGRAFDPAATADAGITSVDLFLGSRDAGGAFLGSAVPGSNNSGDMRAWQVKVTLAQNNNGGRDFVAYATSSITGQATTVSVPVFVGAAPTPTPTGTNVTPVALTETTSSTCQGATTTAPAAPAGVPAFSRLPASISSTPVLSLANPSADGLLPLGDLIVEGQAYDPAATSGSGIDSVQVFLDSRDTGGQEIGSGVPGASGSDPRAFAVKASIPNNANGGHNLVVYVHSSITGRESVTSVPVFIGVAPTPTPRPKS